MPRPQRDSCPKFESGDVEWRTCKLRANAGSHWRLYSVCAGFDRATWSQVLVKLLSFTTAMHLKSAGLNTPAVGGSMHDFTEEATETAVENKDDSYDHTQGSVWVTRFSELRCKCRVSDQTALSFFSFLKSLFVDHGKCHGKCSSRINVSPPPGYSHASFSSFGNSFEIVLIMVHFPLPVKELSMIFHCINI